MIDRASLPTWDSIFTKEGLISLRRGRGCCPFCDSHTGFSCNEEKGFHCFACGVKGDKISFIQTRHECDFKGAMRFFGIEAGKPPQADPERLQQQKARQQLQAWAKAKQRQLRNEFYLRNRIELYGKRRLEKDPEDPIGWQLLHIAYTGVAFEELENWLDLLIGKDQQQLEAYKILREL